MRLNPVGDRRRRLASTLNAPLHRRRARRMDRALEPPAYLWGHRGDSVAVGSPEDLGRCQIRRLIARRRRAELERYRSFARAFARAMASMQTAYRAHDDRGAHGAPRLGPHAGYPGLAAELRDLDRPDR